MKIHFFFFFFPNQVEFFFKSGEDDIEATVKSLIDAGTCDGVGILKMPFLSMEHFSPHMPFCLWNICQVTYATDATTDECGDAATSYYKEFVYNGKRVIISNNVKTPINKF